MKKAKNQDQKDSTESIQILNVPQKDAVAQIILNLAQQVHQVVITLLAPGRKSREQMYQVRDTLETLISNIKCD